MASSPQSTITLEVPCFVAWMLAISPGGVPGVPTHAPLLHASPVVHAFPSLQLVPSVAFGFEHNPVPGLHVPARWHWSLGEHTSGLPLTHEPLWQVSATVQPFPSEQLLPSAFAGFEQAPVPVLQVPAR